jgi:hypothetical protein
MSKQALAFRIPEASWTLEFTPQSLDALTKRVQKKWWSKESVGQLYTRDLTQDRILVDSVTTLGPKRAAFARVRFDPKRAMAEREDLFAGGLHCVGFWHSHPEDQPHPSWEDLVMARDHAQAAVPQLAGLVFVIVGRLPFPAGLGVWVDDGERLWEAAAVREIRP